MGYIFYIPQESLQIIFRDRDHLQHRLEVNGLEDDLCPLIRQVLTCLLLSFRLLGVFFFLSLSLSHRWCSTFYFAKLISDFFQPWISVEVISSYFLLHGDSSPIRGKMFRFFQASICFCHVQWKLAGYLTEL